MSETSKTPEQLSTEESADAATWAALMRGNLEALREHICAGNVIEPDSLVAEFLLDAMASAGEFELRLVTRGRRQPWFERCDALDRRVRIGWFIEALLQRGRKYDDAVADAVKEFGIGRKSAEAELTFFRKSMREISTAAQPLCDQDLIDFADAWYEVMRIYPNG